MAALTERDMQELRAELAQGKAMYEKWENEQLQTLQQVSNTHFSVMKSYQDEIYQYKQIKADKEQQAQSVEQRYGADNALIETERASLTDMRDQLAGFPEKLSALKVQLVAQNQANVALQKEITAIQAENSETETSIKYGKVFYEQRLGMAIRRAKGANTIRITFTHLNAQYPAKQYWFELLVDESNMYKVAKASVVLVGLDSALNALNSTGDMSVFVCYMRKRLKEVALKA